MNYVRSLSMDVFDRTQSKDVTWRIDSALNSQYRIRAPIIYLPSSEPFPMSIRRQQAYEAGALLPGPQSDINGWFALPKASVRGFFNEILGAFGKRELDFDCVVRESFIFVVRNQLTSSPSYG